MKQKYFNFERQSILLPRSLYNVYVTTGVIQDSRGKHAPVHLLPLP